MNQNVLLSIEQLHQKKKDRFIQEVDWLSRKFSIEQESEETIEHTKLIDLMYRLFLEMYKEQSVLKELKEQVKNNVMDSTKHEICKALFKECKFLLNEQMLSASCKN